MIIFPMSCLGFALSRALSKVLGALLIWTVNDLWISKTGNQKEVHV